MMFLTKQENHPLLFCKVNIRVIARASSNKQEESKKKKRITGKAQGDVT